MNETGTVFLPVKGVPGYLPGQAGPRAAAEPSGASAYLLPDHNPPPWWFWVELGPRLRRRPRCEGAED